MAAPAETRDRLAFDHFFRLSQALRGIETAGKPGAAAIAGLAIILFSSALRKRSASGGVFAGAISANQPSTSKPSSP